MEPVNRSALFTIILTMVIIHKTFPKADFHPIKGYNVQLAIPIDGTLVAQYPLSTHLLKVRNIADHQKKAKPNQIPFSETKQKTQFPLRDYRRSWSGQDHPASGTTAKGRARHPGDRPSAHQGTTTLKT